MVSVWKRKQKNKSLRMFLEGCEIQLVEQIEEAVMEQVDFNLSDPTQFIASFLVLHEAINWVRSERGHLVWSPLVVDEYS